ncbi:MAG: hypothetical protein LWW82_06660 [Comamonadaceae bacterium]|nr:hypothetical protein [Comamonadaceae bacterium]
MDLELLLTGTEDTVQAAADALLAADAQALERSSTLLRSAAAALVQVLGPAGNPALTPEQLQRLRALNTRLLQVRDQLARVAALANSQAASVLPPTDKATYGASAGAGARIYRALG